MSPLTQKCYVLTSFFLVDFNRIVVGEDEDYINAVAIQVGHDMFIILINIHLVW